MYSLEHRPISLDTIVGQKGIIREMKKRSLTRDFPEVMIFHGPSGTGKTTLAYIIAGIINEKNPIEKEGFIDPNPDSISFQSILKEKFSRDIHFYDASSLNKEEMQKLENIASSAPMYDTKKVLIIDEAQEITNAGKGVALRLLEKKRKNSHIILCTMNIGAFDKAVQTRGINYKFKEPNPSEIAGYLFSVVAEEGLLDTVPEVFLTEGIFSIAENSSGSVREAVQNLERCIMSEIYTPEDIIKELGLYTDSFITDALVAILNGKSKDIIDGIFKDPMSFHLKAAKIVSESEMYKYTGYIDQSWKKKNMERLISSPNFDKIVEVIYNLSREVYFRESVFKIEMARLFKSVNQPPVITKPKRMPV